jgi:uncharacterized integral membrane protein
LNVKLAGILALVLLLLVIVFQNSEPVTVELFFWKLSMPGILLYPLIFFLGAAAGCVACIVYLKKKN